MTTELAFALDMSGSMHPLTGALRQGFNSLLAHQRELDKGVYGDALVHTVLFNTKIHEYHDRAPIDKAPDLDETYRACGCTALVDAIAALADRLELIHRYSRREDIPDRTVVMVFTDGTEFVDLLNEYDCEQPEDLKLALHMEKSIFLSGAINYDQDKEHIIGDILYALIEFKSLKATLNKHHIKLGKLDEVLHLYEVHVLGKE